jgi:hypothetical protein
VSVTIIATGFGNSDINVDLNATTIQTNKPTHFQPNNIKPNQQQSTPQEPKNDWSGLDNKQISEIENVPAYKRRKANYNDNSYRSGNVVKFSLDDD